MSCEGASSRSEPYRRHPHLNAQGGVVPLPYPMGVHGRLRAWSDTRKTRLGFSARLSKIEGQVRGIERMVEQDRYCIDVLTQVHAIKAGLDKVALLLLADHVGHCVVDAVRTGEGDARLKELTDAIGRFVGA